MCVTNKIFLQTHVTFCEYLDRGDEVVIFAGNELVIDVARSVSGFKVQLRKAVVVE